MTKDTIVKNNDIINICLAADDNYVQHCAVTIASILKNSKTDNLINFYILDGGISKDNKLKIKNLSSIKDFKMVFCDMTKFNFSDLPLNRGYISAATYYRLYILDIIPQEIKKLIYLDCDIVVKSDIKELWEYNISDYLAAVVEDEGSINQLTRMCLPKENNYFNAGVILLNLDKLRQFDYKEKCFNFFEKNKEIITLQDQDILNGVFNGKCRFIDLRWNANGRLYKKSDLKHFYTEQDIKIAKNNPAILHFTDVEKPWLPECTHPLRYEYFRYLLFTDFRSFILPYLFKCIFEPILSVKKSVDKTHTVIRVLGIKIKKKSYKKGDKNA